MSKSEATPLTLQKLKGFNYKDCKLEAEDDIDQCLNNFFQIIIEHDVNKKYQSIIKENWSKNIFVFEEAQKLHKLYKQTSRSLHPDLQKDEMIRQKKANAFTDLQQHFYKLCKSIETRLKWEEKHEMQRKQHEKDMEEMDKKILREKMKIYSQSEQPLTVVQKVTVSASKCS
eukprot:Pgem_evm1s11014